MISPNPAFFATQYTIHFDDTMAYGSHHFLTGFKFQCAARESFLFGERVFDIPGVMESLDRIHLLTLDAYSRNLSSAVLGDRVAILLSLEDWGDASARFCYRVINSSGQRVCAGFQTLVCADAVTGHPIPLPNPLREAMNAMRQIEEPQRDISFRDRVLAGGISLDELFDNRICDIAIDFLKERYPAPSVIPKRDSTIDRDLANQTSDISDSDGNADIPSNEEPPELEVWVFAGQGSFHAGLMGDRLRKCEELGLLTRQELLRCIAIAQEMLGGDVHKFFTGTREEIEEVAAQTPNLKQLGIHLQNVLGAKLRGRYLDGLTEPAQPVALMGHSFGEIAAFTLAGCLSFQDGIRAVCSRCLAVDRFAPSKSGLLAVMASREFVKVEMGIAPVRKIVVAGRNHEQQTIVSGPLDELHLFKSHMSRLEIRSILVASPTSFHHPDLNEVAQEWLNQLRELEWHAPVIPIYTPIGRRQILQGEDAALVLATQLLRPFDFLGALRDMKSHGIDRFVDCGTTGALVSLINEAGKREWKVLRSDDISPASNFPPQQEQSHRHPSRESSHLIADSARGALTQSSPEIEDRSSVDNSIVISGMGCILPAGASSPERLLEAIETQRLGIVDMRDSDPLWQEDFYSESLTADRSTSFLFGRVREDDLVMPDGMNAMWFEGLTRTQKLLCIAIAPCLSGLKDAERIVCLVGSTADGFEDQDEAASYLFAGIEPPLRPDRASRTSPHAAVEEVLQAMIGPEVEVVLIDAACASSLYTVSLGMDLLMSDRADAVLAGGVFCPGPGNSCLFSQFRGMTSTGCRPFDRNADGVVFSEGAAFVSLRKIQTAKDSGIPIHAVIQGAGLSSDGKSSSANVPQTSGQILSLHRAYGRFSIDPSSISAIEGHGTSTPVGDSTEVETLHRFFADKAKSKIPLHSLKGTLGHAGWAAGTASMIAACMYLARKTFPGQAFFKTPSGAIQKSSAVLQVLPSSQPLLSHRLRIAVDGFGFGGANAHLVLESPKTYQSPRGETAPTVASKPFETADKVALSASGNGADHDVVIVAFHEIAPTVHTALGNRFDRSAVTLANEFIVLPELLDDMDISQKLAVLLGKRTIEKLPGFDVSDRVTTSVVLAMSEKTERGVEATFRVLFQRLLRGEKSEPSRQALAEAYRRARPSGAYTLQCMMPNVASGRAALLLNLNGPNFVVDAGSKSLVSALESARLILNGGEAGGSRLVLVEAIKANSQRYSNQCSSNLEDECAACFALTTRSYALEKSWTILSSLEEVLPSLQNSTSSLMSSQITTLQNHWVKEPKSSSDFPRESVAVDSMELGKVESRENQQPSPEHPVFTPVWVQRELAKNIDVEPETHRDSTIFIIQDDVQILAELAREFDDGRPVHVFVIGSNAKQVCERFSFLNAIAVEEKDIAEESPAIKNLTDTNAKRWIAIHQPKNWDLSQVVPELSNNNSLCEFVFLAAKAAADELERGNVSIWQIVWRGWDSSLHMVHPCSGPFAGMIKAIHREFPRLVGGSICTSDLSLPMALEQVERETAAHESEWEVCVEESRRLVRRLSRVSERPRNEKKADLSSHSVVVATGGAKGVTAVMLEAIAREYGCNIIALGRSHLEPPPVADGDLESRFYRDFLLENPGTSPLEMKRKYESARSNWEAYSTVQSLRKMGANVEYMAVDVNDPSAVDQAVDRVVQKYGRIDLIIHGAGVQYSKKLRHRSLREFRDTFSAKVTGLCNLVSAANRLLRNEVAIHPLTSAFSIFGNDGQHDYGAANETMDRMCELARSSRRNWFSIAWLAWEGVGMTRGSEYRALAEARQLSGITPPIGQQIFLAAIQGKTDVAVHVPMTDSEHLQYNVKTVPAIGFSTSTRNVSEFELAPGDVPCLAHHLVRNAPTIPGAWILDSFARCGMQTLCSAQSQRGTSFQSLLLRDIRFLRFLRPSPNHFGDIRVVIEANNDGGTAFMIQDIRHSSGRLLAKDILCAQASFQFRAESVDELAGKESILYSRDSFTLSMPSRIADPYCLPDGQVHLSGPFDCITEIQLMQSSRTATIRRPAQPAWDTVIPAIELDAIWRLGAMYAGEDSRALFAPVSIQRVILPVQQKRIHGRYNHGDGDWWGGSVAPTISANGAHWSRSEVRDQRGKLILLVENATANLLT